MTILLYLSHLWQVLQSMRAAARQRAEFARLSARELHDLGLGRCEFDSCLLEAEGRIEVTRLRLWHPAGRGPGAHLCC